MVIENDANIMKNKKSKERKYKTPVVITPASQKGSISKVDMLKELSLGMICN